MKFQHLPIGARFEYEGKRYTKTSPLVAAEEGGGQRMIPRYAGLSALSGEMAVASANAVPDADTAAVFNAFAEFEEVAAQLLHEACGADEERSTKLQTGLTAAAQVFRNKIKQ